MNEKYAYHIISENFVGNIIYPLSELKNIHPEIANKAAEKYIGREKNVENIVYNPDVHINFDWGKDIVRWNDVSFFTLHNPKRVFETFKELNIFSWVKGVGYTLKVDCGIVINVKNKVLI